MFLSIFGRVSLRGTKQSSFKIHLLTMSNPKIKFETNFGEIILELFPQSAPKAVENFVGLTKQGYYDGIIFHRVIRDFMIQ